MAKAIGSPSAKKMGQFCLTGPVFPGMDEMRSGAEVGEEASEEEQS